jgi:hypothetical protein
MSQINDALIRAKKSQKSRPPNLPPGAAPLPPIENRSGGGTGWLLLVILLVAIGCVFIGLAIANQKPQPQPQPPAPVQAVVIPVTPKPALALPTPPPPQTNVVVTPPKPVPPTLKLQGILMGSGTPQAIVNGQTVYAGDTVNGFRVQTISQYKVLFLAPDGTQKMLALGK